MEQTEKSEEVIQTEIVKNLSQKDINHSFLCKFAKWFLFAVLLSVMLIGVILISIFVYFEYMDNHCMSKCMQEWNYSQDVCNNRYCN